MNSLAVFRFVKLPENCWSSSAVIGSRLCCTFTSLSVHKLDGSFLHQKEPLHYLQTSDSPLFWQQLVTFFLCTSKASQTPQLCDPTTDKKPGSACPESSLRYLKKLNWTFLQRYILSKLDLHFTCLIDYLFSCR